MFEAYRIGITLALKNEVGPQLLALSKEFEKLDTLVSALNKNLSKITLDSTGFRSLTTATNENARALDKAAISAEAYERRLQAIQRASLSTHFPGSGAPRLPSGGGGRSGGGFHGGNLHVGTSGIGIGAAGFALGDAFWPLAAGGAAMYAGKSLYEAAKDRDTEITRLGLFGMTGAQNAAAINYASGLRIYGTSQTERLAAFREAQGVGRESGLSGAEALEFSKIGTPLLAQLDALNASLDGEGKASAHAANISLLRFAEQSGGNRSPARLKELANIAFKLQQSSGDTVDYAQLRAMTQTGGAYTQNMTAAGYAHSEPILAEMGGSAYGTALTTAGNRLTGVTRPTQILAQEALRLGLWNKSDIIFNKEGNFKAFKEGKMGLSADDLALFRSDFPEFYRSRLKPLYDKAGITGDALTRENAILFNRTGGRAANLVDKALPIMDNAYSAFTKAKDIDAATNDLRKSLTGEEQEFTAAWTDFKTQWGTSMLPMFTNILKIGADLLRNDSVLPQKKGTGFWESAVNRLTPEWATLGTAAAASLWGDRGESRFVGSGQKTTVVKTKVQLDGRTIADVVTHHQGNDIKMPETGMTVFDTLASPTPAGGY